MDRPMMPAPTITIWARFRMVGRVYPKPRACADGGRVRESPRREPPEHVLALGPSGRDAPVRRPMRGTRWFSSGAVALMLGAAGCTMPEYLVQAGCGQLDIG